MRWPTNANHGGSSGEADRMCLQISHAAFHASFKPTLRHNGYLPLSCTLVFITRGLTANEVSGGTTAAPQTRPSFVRRGSHTQFTHTRAKAFPPSTQVAPRSTTVSANNAHLRRSSIRAPSNLTHSIIRCRGAPTKPDTHTTRPSKA